MWLIIRYRSSVTSAQEAFNTAIHSEGRVALSLGAYGATMIPGQEYSGKYDLDHMTIAQLRDWHLKRIGAFFPGISTQESEDAENDDEEVLREKKECWEVVDFVAFETLPLIREVEAV